MNAPGRKNIYSKSTIETPEQTVKFLNTVKFIRTVLELIKVSQLVLGVQFETLNMYFETGLNFDVIRIFFANQIFIYFIFFFQFYIDFELESYAGAFKYPASIYLFKLNNRHARTRCGMYSSLVIKTPEQRHSSRSGVFIANFEHI